MKIAHPEAGPKALESAILLGMRPINKKPDTGSGFDFSDQQIAMRQILSGR